MLNTPTLAHAIIHLAWKLLPAGFVYLANFVKHCYGTRAEKVGVKTSEISLLLSIIQLFNKAEPSAKAQLLAFSSFMG